MKKLLLAVVIVIGLGIGYYSLYQYNYNEAKDAMSLVMPKLVYVLPTFEILENKKFNELIEKYAMLRDSIGF